MEKIIPDWPENNYLFFRENNSIPQIFRDPEKTKQANYVLRGIVLGCCVSHHMKTSTHTCQMRQRGFLKDIHLGFFLSSI